MSPNTNKIGLVTRADGREVRRLVAYLPPGIMQKVRLYCAETGVSMSKLTTVAMATYLESQRE